MYAALPTIESTGSSDSPGGNNPPRRQAPALPPRSGSSSSAITEDVSPGTSSTSTAAASSSSTSGPLSPAPTPPAEPPKARSAGVGSGSSVQRATSAPSPNFAGAGAAAGGGGGAPGRGVFGSSSNSSVSSSRSNSGGGGVAGAPPRSPIHRDSWVGAMHDGAGGGSGGGGEGGAGTDGLFHDAQDVPMPTLSVYDPDRLWEYVERPLMVYMPLRKLSAKPPAVSSAVNIDELPVRCLVHRTLAGTEVAARLVDSPAERYRASFAFIYMVSAESQEHYKQTVRPLIRAWVDKVEARGGGEDGPGWLLLYVIVAPQGGGSSDAAAATAAAVDAQGKIFWWLCADFYGKTPGDRCSLVSLYVDGTATPAAAAAAAAAARGGGGDQRGAITLGRSRPSASPRHHPKQWSDLLAKVGRVVVEVFEARVRSYAGELAHLDATRGMIGWDFGNFFVVKESLALMYKELQLPSEALLKYQELAALILTMGDSSESSLRSPSASRSPVRSPICSPKDPSTVKDGSGASQLLFGLAVPGRPEREPASVLDYGQMRFRERVNGGRLHSLVLETQLYIFARQCALNLELKKPAEVARMGGRFMPAYYHELIGQAADLQEGAGGWGGDFDDGSQHSTTTSSTVLDPAEVELFALKSSWDVVKACDRYFARALNPGGGLEPSPREVAAIRQSRVETSKFLAELLEFAQTRLLEYARLVAVRGRDHDDDDDDDGGGFDGSGEALMGSCVWELQERGFLASQRNWVPQDEPAPDAARAEAAAAAAAAAAAEAAAEAEAEAEAAAARSRERDGKLSASRIGRMRVEGSLVDVKAVSGKYFWDCDEEGEVFIPPHDAGVKRFNPMKVITGGDGVPSPQKSRQSSNHITDFDDDEDESDGTDTSEGSNTGAAAPTPRTAAAKAAASAAETALSKLAAAKANDGGRGGGGGDAGMWLLDRPEALEDAYLQLTHSLGQHNQRAGRSRAAARCWGRRVELLLERGEVGVAQARLSALADLYQTEGWLPQAFWALHRLARCRRTLALSPGDDGRTNGGGGGRGTYVSTVMRLAEVLKDPRVRSEGGKAAVEKAAAALLRDARSLAADVPPPGAPGWAPLCPSPERSARGTIAPSASHILVGDPASGGGGGGGRGHAYRLRCFAEASLAVVDESDAKDGGARGRGNKVTCRRTEPLPAVHVGDPLFVSCVLTSHLPEAVELDSLTLEMTLDGAGGGGTSRSGQAPSEPQTGGGGGRGGERSNQRRPSPKRTKVLRRLESIKTVVVGDDSSLSPAGSPVPSKLQPPPPPPASSSSPGAASQALLASGAAAADTPPPTPGTGGHGGIPGFQVPLIRTARSQSLSPRISGPFASATTDDLESSTSSLVRIGSSRFSSNPGSRPPITGIAGGGGGRSRSPGRHSVGLSSSSSQGHPSGAASRVFKARPRPTCSATVEGPLQLAPGDTEVVFCLRPTMAGVLTASRVTAVWGGVTLVDALAAVGGGGGGRGKRFPGVAALPSAGLGAPRPPPSAVVRPFRPRAALEVSPPSFLPLGNEGWMTVTVTAGPDTLRGACVRVTAGRGLAWGDPAAARVRWRRRRGGSGVSGPGSGPEVVGGGDVEPVAAQPAQARAGDEPTDVLVDLGEVLRPSCAAEFFLRVRSTGEAAAAAAAAAAAGGARSASFTPRPCVLKAELQAWHSRAPEGDRGRASGDGDDHGDVGVECRTNARATFAPRLPFEARVTVTPRRGGVVFAQSALVSTSPVALSLRSCELCRLEPGAEVLSDPNGFLNDEVLPPGQPLRLAACLRRPSAATAAATAASAALAAMSVGSAKPARNGDAPLAVHRLRYSIGGGGGGGDGSEVDEIFAFDVCIPSPSDGKGNASPGGSRAAAGSQRSLTTTVRPCGDGSSSSGGGPGEEDGVLQLRLAEAREFEFGVAGGGGSEGDGGGDAGQSVTYRVVAPPSDWMVSGLVKGTAKLELKSGKQLLCRVHLVPIRSGLLALPRLDVTLERGNASQGDVAEVWSPHLRKVLVLPPGDTASVCQARAP